MTRVEIDQVLSQIRTLRSQASAVKPPGIEPAVGLPGGAPGATSQVSFGALLRNGIEKVNETQAGARRAATDFEMGKPGVELPQVMLEMQKASVSFRAAVEVRNRLVNAYQEIMNMPV